MQYGLVSNINTKLVILLMQIENTVEKHSLCLKVAKILNLSMSLTRQMLRKSLKVKGKSLSNKVDSENWYYTDLPAPPFVLQTFTRRRCLQRNCHFYMEQDKPVCLHCTLGLLQYSGHLDKDKNPLAVATAQTGDSIQLSKFKTYLTKMLR